MLLAEFSRVQVLRSSWEIMEMASREELFDLVDSISFPEANIAGAAMAVQLDEAGQAFEVSEANLQLSVLSKFTEWLSKAGVVPSKADALAWLSEAIDAGFTQVKNPILANLLKPIVKQLILDVAGNIYDSLFGTAIL